MGRRRKEVPPPEGPAEGEIGHNSDAVVLTSDQEAVLFFQHKRKYDEALAAKKAADAKFKHVCKLAKSELGDDAVAMIKDALLLETEEGEKKLMAQIERQKRVAVWMAVPMFAQADFFGAPDVTPAIDRARAEGKRDGLAGKVLQPPYDPSVPQYDSYAEGWYEGQRALFSIQRQKDAPLFEDDGNPDDVERLPATPEDGAPPVGGTEAPTYETVE